MLNILVTGSLMMNIFTTDINHDYLDSQIQIGVDNFKVEYDEKPFPIGSCFFHCLVKVIVHLIDVNAFNHMWERTIIIRTYLFNTFVDIFIRRYFFH